MFESYGNEIKKAIKYTRVSTNQQDDKGSKEIQDLKINEFAIKNNFDIVASFSDTDHGDNPLRPGINSLKDYLRVNREVKYVICLYADRFTRSFREAMENLYFLEDLGVTLVTLNEGIIKIDGSFQSIASMVHFMGAQEEKKKIVKKTKDSMYNYAITSNRFLGGSILPWFKVVRGNLNGVRCSLIVKNEETWDFYKKVFIDVIKFSSVKKSSETNNIPYPTLREWLHKPEIAGYRTFGKRGRNENNYKKGRRKTYQISEEKLLPALLDDDEMEKIRNIYANSFSYYQKKSYPYLFTKLAHCVCGGKYYGNHFISRGSSYNYYKCEKCNKRYLAKKLEKIIIENLMNDDSLKMLNDYDFRISDLLDEITKLEQQKSIEQKKENDILNLITEDLISMDTAKEKLKGLKDVIRNIQKEISKIEEDIEREKNKEITSDMLESFRYLLLNYDEDTLEELQQILNLIIKKIIIHSYNEIEIVY